MNSKRVNVISDVRVSTNDERHKAAYAQITQDRNGRIYVIYRQGIEKHSYDGVSILQFSEDQGVSWSTPVIVGDFTKDTPPKSVVTTTAYAETDGSIRIWNNLVDASKVDDYLFSDAGFKLDHWLVHGRYQVNKSDTVAYAPVDPGPHSHLGVTSHPIRLADQTFFAPYEVSNSKGAQATAALVDDEILVDCASDTTGRLSLCDGHVTELADGRLLMLLWTFEKESEAAHSVRQIFSSDSGRTWTLPDDTHMLGQVAVPLALDKTTVIAAVNVRKEPQGIRLTVSNDNGKHWETNSVIQLYDLNSEGIQGKTLEQMTSDGMTDGVWDELQSFKFGTPDLLRLDDGSVVMSYYATLDDVTHVRVCRFEMLEP